MYSTSIVICIGASNGPLGPDLLATMRPDDPAGAKFFKRVAKLMVATDLFEQANEVHALSDEMRLLWLVMAAEGCLPTTTRAS